jgi:carbon storage regulator
LVDFTIANVPGSLPGMVREVTPVLVLSRKSNESIIIGDNIVIRVLRVEGNKVRIGIEAPSDVPILRDELQPHEDSPLAPHRVAAVGSR